MAKPAAPKLAKDALLLQLALLLLRGEVLTHERLRDEFLLRRRSAERRLNDLRAVGLPIVAEKNGRESSFYLDRRRAKLSIEAIDVPPKAARALSLLVVAASLLPKNLGIQDAIDRTVRAALRVRGLKASAELRRASDAVLVLENEAKDYAGKEEMFGAFVDAVLEGTRVSALYASPRKAKPERLELFCASVGLYKGGLYVLGVDPHDDGALAHWYALERFTSVPVADAHAARLSAQVRLRALDEAKRRWGPATKKGRAQIVTLAFSKAVAPYVRARSWHDAAEWETQDDGTVRMSLRLSGETAMFESWLKSWGKEVRVLRPREMAERLAAELDEAARAHREASAQFARELDD